MELLDQDVQSRKKINFKKELFRFLKFWLCACEHAAVLYGCLSLPQIYPTAIPVEIHCFSNNRRTVPKVLWATLKTLAWGERR
jgi:hypothetical protein